MCDLVQIRTLPGGTTVRLHMWFPPSAPQRHQQEHTLESIALG
jgi:hypothetical protein